jgi:PAS domain S-box-containing protein
MDVEGCIASWTPEIQRSLGYEEGEFLDQHVGLIFTPEDRKNRVPEAELEGARRTGRAEDVRWHQRKDGSLFWANGQMLALRDEDGELRGFAKILRDDTRHKQNEDALRDTRERLQSALDAGSIGTWEWDVQADRMVADTNLARFFGLSPAEAAGGSVELYMRVIHPDDAAHVEGGGA